MRAVAAAATVAAATLLAFPAFAATRQASIGNYWYEEDTQRDQTKITVRQGDQVTFTVREASVPGHTVDVDALDIHSPNLSIGQTYTTPPLNRTGNFYLYCRPHEQRGHHTRLVVQPAAAKTPPPAPKTTPRRTAPPARAAPTRAPATPKRTPSPTPAPSATLTPVGVGTAPPGELDRPVPTNPNSLGALTGRRFARGAPWTRSLWWLAFAAVPIIGAAAVALRRARIAEYQPTVANLRRARTAPAPKKSRRPPAKKRPAKKPPRKR